MTKILIIRLSSIGDIFHTFTVLPDIKKAIPDSSIDWLVDESFKEIAELCPLIDNVISIPLRTWKKNKLQLIPNLFRFKRTLENKNYDYIIDTQGLIKTAILANFLFKGYIHGLHKYSAREPYASFLYSHQYRVNQRDIAVVRLRRLIAQIFNLGIDLRTIDFIIKKEDCQVNFDCGTILFLHGTSKENKKWSLEYWCEMAIWLINNSQEQILLTYSSQKELDFANSLIKKVNSPRISLIGKLKFAQLADLIAKSNLVIGVDTGFTHLANLMKVPTLGIYLNSDPNYVGLAESKIAHNFGGRKKQVLPAQIIEYINQNNLL